MQALFEDLKFSVRTLAKSPGFSLTAVLTVALGIGAVTAIFSIVNSVLLKPFSFARPERLVSLRETGREHALLLPANYQHYLNWKKNAKTLEDATIFRNRAFSVAAGVDHPEMIGGLVVSPNFFSVLGVQPVLGRGFVDGEELEGRSDVVVLSWSAWQRYFHGEADAVGKSLRVDGRPQTVVGVLPRDFSFPYMSEMKTAVSQRMVPPTEIFRPITPDPSPYGDHNFLVIALLRDGVTLEQARGELDTIQQALARTTAHMSNVGFVSVEPLQQEVTGSASRALWLLLASVGVVLLIGCVNLANLQMARTVAREREFAVRMALGAERVRMLRLTLMDSVVLAVAGGALGVVFAFGALRALLALAPANLPRLHETAISWPVLLVAAGLSLVTAVLFGVLPALRGLRVSPQAAMQAGTTRVANTREGQRTRSLLVAGEFTIPGIGKLVKAERKARMGRNPQTGEQIKIKAKTVVKFRVAKVAKDTIAPPKK